MPPRPLRVAMLVVDDRSNPLVGSPTLGAAPTALLQGLADLGAENVEVHVVTCMKQSGVSACRLAPNIWYHPLKVPSWTFLRTLHLGPALAVRRFLHEKVHPDVVHSQGIEWWCGVAGALSGYPSVLTIHGNIRAILANSVLRPRAFWQLQATLGDFAIRRHSGLICISEHVRKSVATATRKTWLIPNALRKEFLQRSKIAGRSQGVPTILIVGTMTENKRPLEILEELFALYVEGSRFEAVFIGRFGSETDYEVRLASRMQEASRLGFARRIDNLGAEALVSMMDQAHAIIHFPMEEAFGLVVAEGISRGLTIFASRAGGLSEVCGDWSGCQLLEKNDFTALRDTLKRWLEDTSRHEKLSETGLRMAFLEPHTIAQQTLQVYREVVTQMTEGHDRS